jgi:hypothetical protein
MLSKLALRYERARRLITAHKDLNLQIVLWTLWTFVVIVTGYMNWRAHVEILGLVIRCIVVGIIGLVVMTKIEMHYQPNRFLE